MGFYFEDFGLGMVISTPERTVTEADVMAFADLSGDRNPLHTDAEFARHTPMGQRVAHGLLGVSIATGLSSLTGHLDRTALAFLSMEQWNFHAPIFFGDRIRLRWTVTDKRLTSSRGAGVLKRKMELLNHKDELVQSGIFVTLIRTRETS